MNQFGMVDCNFYSLQVCYLTKKYLNLKLDLRD